MNTLRIAIGADHAGFEYKSALQQYLKDKNVEVVDFGTYSADSVDYPDFAHKVAENVEKKQVDLGILVCGSGNGVAMTANKHTGVRAALCWNEELGKLARQHNNANVLCLPSRFVPVNTAIAIADAFLNSKFEGGRHQNRVDKISC